MSDLLKGKSRNGLAVWIKEDLLKGRVSPTEKKLIVAKDEILTEKVDLRSTQCWLDECSSMPSCWIREIQYDLSKPGTGLTHASVSTDDYTGPTPGFCPKHVISGPELLVKAVYLNRPEVQWGFFPERAVVIYTDGIKTEFESVKFAPSHEIISEDIHTKGS